MVVEIPVVYDGGDLDDVARATGLEPDEVIARHIGSSFRVDGGFAPGFAVPCGPRRGLVAAAAGDAVHLVPAGSVAIAKYSAVYPGVSPGGWHLLGTTAARVWDADRVPPALLEPGTEVRFVRVVAT